ncbi:MAG TPA: 5,6-dimethylbenzimidazole synthase [Thiobacillus sp.]|nr:MAG: 5,6-dimethylbenzimidazole synthase [Hydrogenophilales bacterium 28-61-11]OYZ57553.1 MAG: 5,6-dimethylbenzimidazole synthase [Hydrogenophilales bacterium 16-61-112]OZA50092.1 MAG: 5,6-dimethylbenzimidazole synthase [Hydrogenophilales bacterium 17-61-76]HQT30294.1 5,6-dimethylbenzimidazole synthase [Thiobacillus sp.]HQT69784.1 5,6-dimethylbenzimidazole synthase [Thiobacillus sp.]
MSAHAYSPAERDAVYRVIRERRDMRHFRPSPVAPEVRQRLLAAAHQAPSVGLMQPWRFIRITQTDLRQRLHALVEAERLRTAEALGERGDAFMRLKVEGILDCGELWVAALMDAREPYILGRPLPEMDLASVACAIQSLWLAARAEGLGLGWVSLFDPLAVAQLLGIPHGGQPVAILCIGQVDAFYDAPMLESEGRDRRRAVADCLFENIWGQS